MTGALLPECEFKSIIYTRLNDESWPGEGGALQTGCAHVTARIRYLSCLAVDPPVQSEPPP